MPAGTTAVILFSHGSLLCGAGEPLRRLAAVLRARGDFPLVEIGYLNYSEPTFAQAVATCAAAGATRIVVAPYFLVPGKFVLVDLPPCIAAAQERFPAIEFHTAAPLGAHPALADALVHCAAAATSPGVWRDRQRIPPQTCRASTACPLFGSARCPRTAAPTTPAEIPTVPPVVTDSALLVMVHGSPQPNANDTMFEVVETVRSRGHFGMVEVGFLECNEPSIASALDNCVLHGVRQVRAVPYFLHAGKHVVADLPALLEAGAARHPQVEFLLGAFLGHDEAMVTVLVERARQALPL